MKNLFLCIFLKVFLIKQRVGHINLNEVCKLYAGIWLVVVVMFDEQRDTFLTRLIHYIPDQVT